MILWPQFSCVWCIHIGPQHKFSSHSVLTQMKQTGPGFRDNRGVSRRYQELSWFGLKSPGFWFWPGQLPPRALGMVRFISVHQVPLLDFVPMWWMLSLVHSRRRTLVNTGTSRPRPRAVIFLSYPPKSVLLAIASHLEIHLFFRWLLTGITSLCKWTLFPLPSGV